MDQLLEILEDLHSDVDYETEDGLVDNGILDSLDIVTLITEINDKFYISIPASGPSAYTSLCKTPAAFKFS